MKGKYIVLFLSLVLVSTVTLGIAKNIREVSAESNIKIESNKIENGENSIYKYENLNGFSWINENEIITLKKDIEDTSIEYCSIYNIETMESRTFKNAAVGGRKIRCVSESGKYALFEGASSESDDTIQDTQFFKNTKILNLQNGEIINLNLEKASGETYYKWIGDDKILAVHNKSDNGFEIVDINGNKYYEANIDLSNSYNKIIGVCNTDEIQDLGDKVEGKIYYTKSKSKERELDQTNYGFYEFDIETKQEKEVTGIKDEITRTAEKRGDVIVTDTSNKDGTKFGLNVYDKDKNLIVEEEYDDNTYGRFNLLSYDGTKAVYVTEPSPVKLVDSNISYGERMENRSINIIDINENVKKEILKITDLKEKELPDDVALTITNCVWNKNNNSIMFTCNYSREKTTEGKGIEKEDLKTNTYVISLEDNK